MIAAILLAAAAAADSSAAPPTLAADSASANPLPAPAAPATPAAAAPLAPPDSAAPAPPAYRPHPAIDALSGFRLEWSAFVAHDRFGAPDDPVEPVGLATLAHVLRLGPSVRTREISQGPGAESAAFDGGASSATELILDGSSLVVSGTSGPHTEEVALSEIAGVSAIRGGASALYGPQAAGGAIVLTPRFPHNEELLARAAADEGVDEFQRASFQASRRTGTRGAFFVNAESRRLDGFVPGTKQLDRTLVARWGGRVAFGWEGEAGLRRTEGDARSGGVDSLSIVPVETHRDDFTLKLFRPRGAERGALVEARVLRAKIMNRDEPTRRTREIETPELRATIDLPRWRRFDWTLRAEASRPRLEWEEAAHVDAYWKGGAAFRWSGTFGGGMRMTETFRIDGEEGRAPALQARFEGQWSRGRFALAGVVSRNERMPGRGAEDPGVNETHRVTMARAAVTTGPATWSVEGHATKIDDVRPEPTFEELRRRDAAERAPLGDGEIRGGTAAFETAPFPVPGAPAIGTLRLRTSYGLLTAELEDGGARLPNRPKRTWTGEGSLERRFFQNELLARARGRLTHLADRVDDEGAHVTDAWVTDVLLEGEIGDAVFYLRFHDLLERADEIEPGYRLPGFSRTYGISWRFWG